MLGEISAQPQLILFSFKPDGTGAFVNFIIVTDPSYIEIRFNNIKNNLGKNERNTGLDFAGSVMQGKIIRFSCFGFEQLF